MREALTRIEQTDEKIHKIFRKKYSIDLFLDSLFLQTQSSTVLFYVIICVCSSLTRHIHAFVCVCVFFVLIYIAGFTVSLKTVIYDLWS